LILRSTFDIHIYLHVHVQLSFEFVIYTIMAKVFNQGNMRVILILIYHYNSIYDNCWSPPGTCASFSSLF